jgi:hypothetical protein
MERRAPSLLALAAITLPVATFAGPTTGGTCNVAEQPAATLLVPYLEVDLDDAGGLTTLVSIVNAAATTPTLAHVVLWTDWGIPSASFDLFLGPGDVAPINLRDVFATGRAPVSGPGAAVFDDCTDVLVPFLSAPERLQAIHTGQPFEGGCFAAPRQDQSLATGYLTVDVIARCSAGITLPLQAGYFGTSAVASLENRLWGDFYLVDPDEDFAQGETAVHLVADPDLVGPGPTFYRKFVGGLGSDARIPLPGEWRTRHLVGGAFDGGTELLVWRDVPSTSSLPVACGSAPSWLPLSSDDVEAWNETGQRTDLDRDAFPLATQRVPVAALDSPFPFGWLDLDLDLGDGEPGQAWVMSILSAEGRFSVGQTGIRLNDPCP